MARSWLIVAESGHPRVVDIRALSKRGVVNAARRAEKAGHDVVAAYQGGPRPIALCSKVWPKPA